MMIKLLILENFVDLMGKMEKEHVFAWKLRKAQKLLIVGYPDRFFAFGGFMKRKKKMLTPYRIEKKSRPPYWKKKK